MKAGFCTVRFEKVCIGYIGIWKINDMASEDGGPLIRSLIEGIFKHKRQNIGRRARFQSSCRRSKMRAELRNLWYGDSERRVLFFLTGSAEIPLREPDGNVTTLLSNGWPRPLRN